MDRFVERVEIDFVGVDNEDGIRSTVEYLRRTGCRTFAFIGSRTVDSSAGERLAAYRRAVTKIDPDGAQRVVLGDYTLDSGAEAAQRLLADGALPDAIVCAADIIALGVIATLRTAGVSVPGEVSVTGFDDIGFAAVSAPPLTTLRQPADEIGAEAVQLLGDRQNGSTDGVQKRRVRPELIVRASTRPIID
jgi:LacI family transcriptional regulator